MARPCRLPRRAWAAASREVLTELPDAALGYTEPWGAWELRRQLAHYQARVRGAMTAPDGVVVVSGATQGLTLLSRLLLMDDDNRIAIEDPSNTTQRQLLRRLGMSVLEIPVDENGLQVDELAAAQTRVVVCTPAHQYPCGVVMSPARRDICCAGRGRPVASSSRTTTTRSCATTELRQAVCRGWIHNMSPCSEASARRWRRHCESAA